MVDSIMPTPSFWVICLSLNQWLLLMLLLFRHKSCTQLYVPGALSGSSLHGGVVLFLALPKRYTKRIPSPHWQMICKVKSWVIVKNLEIQNLLAEMYKLLREY